MIKTIEDIKEYFDTIKTQIIPKLKEFNGLSLFLGDTLVAFVDSEKWDVNNIEEFCNLFIAQNFPLIIKL